MKSIIILTDYKNFFGSKQLSPVYRGGMDLDKIISYFNEQGYDVRISSFTEFNPETLGVDQPYILYTSSEDKDEKYKSFIEDIIFDLEQRGLSVIPSFACLKAHNNKVAMELMRARTTFPELQTIHSRAFGTLEELKRAAGAMEYPLVVKTYAGAMSRGVAKADNKEELIKKAAKFSKSLSFRHDLKEFLRKVKYRNRYVQESCHRTKFIVQNLIEGLDNDWKVLVYGNRCYALRRDNRENDFRASGSGKFLFSKDLPSGMLDFALKVRKHFNVPQISLDIAFDGIRFHLIEFQFIDFGTTTIEKAPHFFIHSNSAWDVIDSKSDLEFIFAKSIIDFITSNDN
jgi:glutathione synthase/RimK-type ligase-like ATP-grasp enzyme